MPRYEHMCDLCVSGHTWSFSANRRARSHAPARSRSRHVPLTPWSGAGSTRCSPSAGSPARGPARRPRCARAGCGSGATDRRASKPSELVPRRRRAARRGGAALRLARRPEARAGARRPRASTSGGAPAWTSGASTGGFTDCLLRRGAARVIALDVGYGQLDWRLRNDPRVEVLERVNARELAPDRPPVRARAGHGRRLLHLAGQGAARRRWVPRAGRRDRRPGQAPVRARQGPGPRRRRPLGVRAPRGPAWRVADAAATHRARGAGVRARPAFPGRRATCETFIWCGAEGAELDDVEAAIARAEP